MSEPVAPQPSSAAVRFVTGNRVGGALLTAAIMFFAFTVIFGLNVVQARHNDLMLAKTSAHREDMDQRRYKQIIRNQQEIKADLDKLLRRK